MSLTLKGIFDHTLFWPHSDQILNSSVPLWPCLETLDVNLDLVTPSGHWYFVDISGSDPEVVHRVRAPPEDPEESSDSAHGSPQHRTGRDSPLEQFRTKPSQRFNQIVLAFAKGLVKMTSIQSATLSVGPYQPWELCIRYSAPRKRYVNRRLEFYLLDVSWRPDQESLDALRRVGKEKWGDDLDELYKPTEYAL